MLYYTGRQIVFDAVSTAVPNARVSFYVTATETPAPVYTDAALQNAHTQPVRSLASGFLPPIYLDPSITYKVITTDENGAALPDGTVDPLLQAQFDQDAVAAVLYPATDSEIAAGVTPTNLVPVLIPDIDRYDASPSATAAANTLSIQDAVDANYGRTVIIPPGTYQVATTGSVTAPCGDAVTITGPITIIFQGVVKGANNCNPFKIAAGAEDFVTFIGWGGGIQGHGTFYELTNNNGALIRISGGLLRCQNIKLIDPPQYALYVDSVADGVMQGVEIIGGPDTYIGDNHYGVCLVDDSPGWKIDGCKTLESEAGGKVSQAIASLTFTTGTADRTQVVNNRLFAQWEKGTYIFGSDLQVNNNWIFDCLHGEGIRTIGARPQIMSNTIRTCESGGITIYDGQQALCVGNNISDYGGVGIQLGYYTTVAGKSLSRATIEGNKIKGRTTGTNLLAAIDVRGHASSATVEERICIRGNEIETANYQTDDERAGIHLLPLTITTIFAHFDVSDNVVAQTGSYGIRCGAGVYKYTKLERNRVTDPGMQHVALGGNRSGFCWDTGVTWTGSHVNNNIAVSENASSGMSYGLENVTLSGIVSTEFRGNVSRGHVTSGVLNINNATNDVRHNRQGDDGLQGTFTMGAAASLAISNTNARASMRVMLYPTNAAAAALQNGAKSLYFDGTVSAGVSFTVKTADTNAAAGTETFAYELVT